MQLCLDFTSPALDRSLLQNMLRHSSRIAMSVGCIAMFGGAISSAQADSTQGLWQVSRVDSQNAGQSYCAVAKRFGTDGVLTFARNQDDKSSLAIDFETNRFSSSNMYDVRLTPDSGEAINYSVQPVSPSAFVIRLGQDNDFERTVSDARYLDVEVNGQKVSYDVADYELVSLQLNECLEQISLAKMQPPPMPADITARKIEDDERRVAASSNRATSAPTEISSAVLQAVPKATALAELSMEEKVKLLERQNLALNKRLRSLGKGGNAQPIARTADNSQELNAMRMRITDLQNKNDLHQKRVALLENELSVSRSAIGEKQEKVAILENSLEQASAGLPTNVQQLQRELLQAKTTLSEQKNFYQGQLNTFEHTLVQNDSAVAELETLFMQRINELETELATVKPSLTGDQRAKLAAYDQLANQLDVTRADMNEQKAFYEQTIASLQQAQTDMANKIASLQSVPSNTGADDGAELRIANLEQLLTEKDRIITSLESNIAQVRNVADSEGDKKLVDDLASLRQALSEKETVIGRLQSKLASAEQERIADASNDGAELKIANLEQLLADKERTITTLEKNIAAANKSPDPVSDEKLVDDLASLRQALSEKETLIGDLQGQLASVEKDKAEAVAEAIASGMQRDTSNVDKLNDDIATLREAMKFQEESFTSRIVMLEQVIVDKEQELAELKTFETQSLAQAPEPVNVSPLDVAKADRIATLEADIEKLRAENAEMSLARANLGNTEVIEENYDLLAKLRRVQSELDHVTQEKQGLRDQVIALQNEKDVTLVNISGDDWDLEQATRRFNEAERQLTGLGRKLDEAQRQCTLEKRSLEYKLFDPAHAGPARTAKLVDLENKLAQSQQQCQAQIAQIQSQNGFSPLFSGGSAGIVLPQAGAPVHVAEISPSAAPSAQPSFRPIAKPQPIINNNSIHNIGAILKNAGVDIRGGLQPTASDAGISYRWDTGTLFGSAEIKDIQNASSYDRYVDSYVGKLRSRCEGDFAAVPVVTSQIGGSNISSYDIACVTPDAGVTVTVIFHGDMNKFTSIAHEASVDHMDLAMDFRDKIVDYLSRSRL